MSRSYCKGRSLFFPMAKVVAALFMLANLSALAQTQQETVVPNRIVHAIDAEQRVTLQHSVHPLARAEFDQGAAPGSMSTGSIMLVLKRSDVQETALKQYLDNLQNVDSPDYHKWLVPEQFGKQFGASEADLAILTSWLRSQGFAIDQVPQARNAVLFSGNIDQVQKAFHTSLHRYLINGETHLANSTEARFRLPWNRLSPEFRN